VTGPDEWGLNHVTVRAGVGTVLHDVTVRAVPGELTVVVGGDGAGKSTVLRTLAGVVRPAAGSVSRPPATQVGFLGASMGVYPDLTVLENLRFAAAAHRLPSSLAGPRIDALLRRTGLDQVPGRLAGRLSGGMRRKLGLLLAVVHEPGLLILDEPTTGVDPVSRADVWWLIAQETARGCAVVVSTSYLDEAERATSVIVLHGGRVLLSGTPDVVTAEAGEIRESPGRPAGRLAWRRGRSWRSWPPDGSRAGATIRPDLQDAVVLAMLRQETGR